MSSPPSTTNINLEDAMTNEQFEQWLDKTYGKGKLSAHDRQDFNAPADAYCSNTTLDHPFDYDWLLRNITTASVESLSTGDLLEHVISLLQENSPDLQNDLLELVGFAHVEFVSDLVTHRQSILLSVGELHNTGKLANSSTTISNNSRVSTKLPASNQSTKVSSKKERGHEKTAQSKEHGSTSNFTTASSTSIASGESFIQSLPNVYTTKPSTVPVSSYISKLALPKGTIHTDLRNFEEFIIPYTASSHSNPKSDAIKIVHVENLDDLAKKAFSSYKSLNRMQSAVYPVAYGTNENILVCAPTGAGKTDAAMLAVLKTIRDHLLPPTSSNGESTIDRNAFKIVYIAPMKALAAEITEKFTTRLRSLGIKVREYTGDMQLTRKEIQETQMLVSTPEKWDVVTRKNQGDVELVELLKLLIIDEVHLLQDERGPVLESLVARTLREVEMSQRMIRIMGLSATLPNYLDVAEFLRVNPYLGLFYFDDSFRPVPLQQTFVGVKGQSISSVRDNTIQVCFEKMIGFLKDQHQILIFVHSRNDTVNTAKLMSKMLGEEGLAGLALPLTNESNLRTKEYDMASRLIQKSRNRDLKDLFQHGFSIHHAGMLRTDRNLVEKLFRTGQIRVLVCTATLAWGINLPAHAVIIKGTLVYDAQKGDFTNIGILDVLQIFGRAGRPQYESHGEGIIITKHDQLARYLGAVMMQIPIESQYIRHLTDNLNAEIALGSVTKIDEALSWLRYTYLYIRMRKNPTAYGITPKDLLTDPNIGTKLRSLVTEVATRLCNIGMISFECREAEGFMRIRNVGRIASLFYLSHETIELFGRLMHPRMDEEELLAMACQSIEFSQMLVREDELLELDHLEDNCCYLRIKHDVTTFAGKTSILTQAYISRVGIDSFSLTSDMNYVSQNMGRIFRAVFEIARAQEWAQCAQRALNLSKSFELRLWPMGHPLAQFDERVISHDCILRLEGGGMSKHKGRKTGKTLGLDELAQMTQAELISLTSSKHYAMQVSNAIELFPQLQVQASICPISKTMLNIKLVLTPTHRWDTRVHGESMIWWIWVEDGSFEKVYYSEEYLVNGKKKSSKSPTGSSQFVSFYLPMFEDPIPKQICVRAVADRWMHAETLVLINVRDQLVIPKEISVEYTKLLPLRPLPITALQIKDDKGCYDKLNQCNGSPESDSKELVDNNATSPGAFGNGSQLIQYYSQKFLYFNSIQTQAFHTLYHTSASVILGAPTGSGKTVIAELAIWQTLRTFPQAKVVYIAPLKALVKERMSDWGSRMLQVLGLRVVEMSGDITPDLRAIQHAQVLVSTPEKWDGISRHWRTRKYVSQVRLVILDEIHLLGSERGPVLEVMITRMRRMNSIIAAEQFSDVNFTTEQSIRIVGLTTALANANDLATWLNIPSLALFNFKPAVRPVPLEVRIEGFPGRHYCPRMASMNKPAYAAIVTLSPEKPVLIFVSSRRQTRITAQALISLCVNEDCPRRFVRIGEDQLATVLDQYPVNDATLRFTLSFGIGMHHGGLSEGDRKACEYLFSKGMIQVMVATSTLAWGLNFPAHLVIVKGTEYFDATIGNGQGGYVDLPLTDVLQMVGRAGRPQFDQSAKAVLLVQERKKAFYRRFLYEAFPLESSLNHPKILADHLNAEIESESIKTISDAISFLMDTFLAVRLVRNPSFYNHYSCYAISQNEAKQRKSEADPQELSPTDELNVDEYLYRLAYDAIQRLLDSHCVKSSVGGQLVEKETKLVSTFEGRVASLYYIGHDTVKLLFMENLGAEQTFFQLIRLVSLATEYDQVPVRHNEEIELFEFVSDSARLRRFLERHFGPIESFDYTDPHVKTFILLIAYISRVPVPISDFLSDTKSICDQFGRILQAMYEVAVHRGWLRTSLNCILVMQSVTQALLPFESSLAQLRPAPKQGSMTKQKRESARPEYLPQLLHNSALDSKTKGTNHSLATIADVKKFPSLDLAISQLTTSEKDVDGTHNATNKRTLRWKITIVNQHYPFSSGPIATTLSFDPYPIHTRADHTASMYILIGEFKSNVLLFSKRIPLNFREKIVEAQVELMLDRFAANKDKDGIELRLVIMIDSYIGLDQEYSIWKMHI